MVFAEAEANTVTDELTARSSLRVPEQEPQKIELLERDISLGSEIGKRGEEGSSVASEAFEESPGPMENHLLPSLSDLRLESEEAGNTAEIAVLPSAPAEPEAMVPILHSSTEEEPPEPTVSSMELKSVDSPKDSLCETTTTAHTNDNVSIPEPTLIRKATPETAVATKADTDDDNN